MFIAYTNTEILALFYMFIVIKLSHTQELSDYMRSGTESNWIP